MIMKTKKIFNERLRGKAFMKVVKWIALVVVVLIALAIVLLPGFISSDKGRRMILDKANKAVAGKMDFASLSMGWFKGLTVKEFSFNDDAGTAQVKIKQITAKPHYASILMGDLSFGRTVLEQPRVELNLTDRKSEAKPEEKKPAEPVALPVSRIDLVVENGDIKVTDKRSTAKPSGTVELSNINSKVNLRPAGSRSEFAMDMMLAQAGKESKISAEGNVTPPREGWSLAGTSGQLDIDVNDLDLGSLMPLLGDGASRYTGAGKTLSRHSRQN